MIDLVLATAIVAQSQMQFCRPEVEILAMVRAFPQYQSHTLLTHEAAQTAGDFYNALPPHSDGIWTHVYMINAKDGTGLLLVGIDGQICGQAGFTPSQWRLLIDKFLGTNS